MKQKFFVATLCGVLLLGIGTSQTAEASVSDAKKEIDNITSMKDLEILVKYIKDRMSSVKKVVKRQNLYVDSITLSHPKGFGSGKDISVGDQKVTVTVKNNEFGDPTKITGKFEYALYLYDVTDGKRKKISKVKAAGVADIPYANGTTEFSAYIEGGMPFNGKDMEKEYMVEVQIDPKNKLKEADENDNKEESDSWEVTYTKG